MSPQVPCFSRIGQLLDEGGFARLAAVTLRKFISPWIESGSIEFFCCDCEHHTPNCLSNLSLSVRQASAEDLSTLLEVYDLSRPEDKILKRWREGDCCFIALTDRGEGVHASWISTRSVRVPELNLKLPLGPGEVYSYDAYTRRDMRGYRIDSAARSFTYRYLYEAGHHEIYLYVRGENLAGLRVAQRFANPAGTIRYWRLSSSGQVLFPHDIHARTLKEFLGEIQPRAGLHPKKSRRLRPSPA
jgi:hypothetical protein